MSSDPESQTAVEPWPNRPLTGSEYFRRCLGTDKYVPLAGLGKHTGSHPVTIRRVFEEAKTRFPEAADVIASLVFFEAVDRNRDEFDRGDIVDRLLKSAPHREAEAKAEILRLRAALSSSTNLTQPSVPKATRELAKPDSEQWEDRRDQWSDRINRAHPMNTGRHDVYTTALEMVGNRHSKAELVRLVCWLLQGQPS